MRWAIVVSVAVATLVLATVWVTLAGPRSMAVLELRAPSAAPSDSSVDGRAGWAVTAPPGRVPREFAAWPEESREGRGAAAGSRIGLPLSFGQPARDPAGFVMMDGEPYLTNSPWSERTRDPYLRGYLAYGYSYSPLWRKVADAAAARGVRVRWQQLPSDVNGLYDPGENSILINSELKEEPGQVVAASLAHEAFHASHDVKAEAGAGFQEEVDAHAWEAYVWSQLPRGKPRTARELHLEELVRLWRAHELNNFVVTMPGYQRAFLGKVLTSP